MLIASPSVKQKCFTDDFFEKILKKIQKIENVRIFVPILSRSVCYDIATVKEKTKNLTNEIIKNPNNIF